MIKKKQYIHTQESLCSVAYTIHTTALDGICEKGEKFVKYFFWVKVYF